MAVYSVHLQGAEASHVADAAFIREGFVWDAFFSGPLWLLTRRLWLAAALWFLAFFVLATLAGLGVLSLVATWTIVLLLQILLGLEADRLFERKLAKRGYHIAQIIAAPALEEAEAAFFRSQEAQTGGAEPPRPPASLPVPEARR